MTDVQNDVQYFKKETNLDYEELQNVLKYILGIFPYKSVNIFKILNDSTSKLHLSGKFTAEFIARCSR